jgi:hypothetical protein
VLAAPSMGQPLAGVMYHPDALPRGVREEIRTRKLTSDEAAKLGNDALRRLSNEVEHRPLITLAIAVGVGILVGLASRPIAGGTPRAVGRPPRRH